MQQSFLVERENNTVTLSSLFDKHCLIIELLGLKDLSNDLQVNCVISFYFYLYLMFHTCAVRFDVTKNLYFFYFLGELTRPVCKAEYVAQAQVQLCVFVYLISEQSNRYLKK